MKNGFQHTQEAIKQRGEVFTPTKMVNEMLDKLPPEVFSDPEKTFLDNSCGNGQFLFQVMFRKMKCMQKKRISLEDAHMQALSTIYGVELDEKNAEECRQRLLNGSTSKKLRAIVDHNIICADALDPNHIGWSGVGFYWDVNAQPVPQPKKEIKEKVEKVEKIVVPVVNASIPKPVKKEPINRLPMPIIRAVSVEDFRKNIERECSGDDAW